MVTLTQTPAAGWQFTGWTGCSSTPANGSCKRTMDQNRAITASYVDVGAPTVSFTGPVENAKLHGVVNVGAVAADNAAVSRVRFYVNNVEIADDINGGDGWGTSFNTNGYPHAQVMTVKAVAFDTSGNASVLGDDDDRNYRVDSQTGLHFDAPTPAEGEWIGAGDPAVTVAFAKNDDTPADSMSFQCAIGGGGLSGCSSPLGAAAFARGRHVRGHRQGHRRRRADGEHRADRAHVPRRPHRPRGRRSAARPRAPRSPRASPPTSPSTEANPAAAGAVTCKLDGGAYGPCGALSGPRRRRATATASRPWTRPATRPSSRRTFSVDGTAPAVAITGGPKEDEIVTSRRGRVHVLGDRPVAPLTRSLPASTAASAPARSATTHSRSGLSEGAHVFELRVADAAGNTTTVKRDFVVNAVRPPSRSPTAPRRAP